ncbi:MAG: CUAEP/CCAEP-tail radical SAM (seleno)protein [SAR324 cluster bacterium]
MRKEPARPADPGAILLLSAYELGHQPQGLTLPAALLREAGFAPRLLDLSTDRLREDWVRQARLVGISAPMHTALVLGVRAAERVRALNPDCHICFYGLYATLNQDYLLKRDAPAGLADSVIGGECEPPLLRLAQALTQGSPGRVHDGERLELPGVSLPGRPAPPYLARIPWRIPARDGLRPLEQYGRLLLPSEDEVQERVAGYVEATRGCKHLCLHCPIPPVYGGRFFAVPRALVQEDIDHQVRQGARHIVFGDPDFLNGPGHALAIARGLHTAHPGVTFDFTAKIEHLLRHRDLLPELKQCGALFVISAVESLSDTVLGHLDKGHTRSDVMEALALLRQTGLVLSPTFVPFTPWSELTDYMELLDWVSQEGLRQQVAPVQLTLRLLVPPGSALIGTPQFAAVRSRLDQAAFTFRWEHPDPRMDTLHAQAQRLVQQAEQEGWPSERAFAALERLAFALTRPDERPRAHPRPALPSLPAPRMKESWFC